MVDEHSNFKPFRMFYFSSDVLSMASPMTTTTMATATVDDMSLMGRVAVLLGSEENALRILLSLLLGMSFLLPQVVYLGAYFHRKALMLHENSRKVRHWFSLSAVKIHRMKYVIIRENARGGMPKSLAK